MGKLVILTDIPRRASKYVETAMLNLSNQYALEVDKWRHNLRAYIPDVTDGQLDRMIEIAEEYGKHSWILPSNAVALNMLDAFLDLAKVGKSLDVIVLGAERMAED